MRYQCVRREAPGDGGFVLSDADTAADTSHMTSTSIGGGSGSYAYNGDGLRASRALGGTTTSYRWDAAAGLSQVLQDSASNTYVYGLDLVSRTDSGGSQEYYLTDGLGSTTGLTTGTGALADTYTYDVYGASRTHTGSSPNEFTFTGEQVDATGLQYLRARYYDSATGRFMSRDPLPFAQRYAYVGNDPVNYVDPRGLCKKTWNPLEAAKECVEKVKEPAKDSVDAAADWAMGHAGYVDFNVTGCLPIGRLPVGPCGTVGVQWEIGTKNVHPYVGGGIGTPGISPALTWAPWQEITQGWSCGAQFSGGGKSYQYGKPISHYESVPFVEAASAGQA